MRFAVVCTTLVVLAVAGRSSAHDALFAQYMATYGRVYTPGSAEFAMRNELFRVALERVEAHNASPEGARYRKGINHLSDRTPAERKAMLGFDKTAHRKHLDLSTVRGATGAPLAASIDWAAAGKTTPVKDQGGCGACWAFSGVEAIESAVIIATGETRVLAPQEFVDCAPDPQHCGGGGGCSGSTPSLLFQYAMTAGAVNETAYNYTAKTGTCRQQALKAPATRISGYADVAPNNYSATMEALQHGPVSIAVAATCWMDYESGILAFNSSGPSWGSPCDYDINHAVLLVGYGTENGTDYWKVQNSWGSGYGEDGFIRVERSAHDNERCAMDTTPGDGTGCAGETQPVKVCGTTGLLYAPSYPTGASVVQ
eukprot:g2587.t1